MALLDKYRVVVRSKPDYDVKQIYEVYESRVALTVDELIRKGDFGTITISKL